MHPSPRFLVGLASVTLIWTVIVIGTLCDRLPDRCLGLARTHRYCSITLLGIHRLAQPVAVSLPGENTRAKQPLLLLCGDRQQMVAYLQKKKTDVVNMGFLLH